MAYRIEKFFSKDNPALLLHQIFWWRESGTVPSSGANALRIDISPEAEGLQVAFLSLESGKTFRAHRHLVRPRMILQTQEAWVVIKGSILVMYYEENGEAIAARVLSPGDMSITYAGGHNYKALESSVVYEFKLGDFSATGDKEYFDALLRPPSNPVVQPTVKQDGPLEGSSDAPEAPSGPGSGHDKI